MQMMRESGEVHCVRCFGRRRDLLDDCWREKVWILTLQGCLDAVRWGDALFVGYGVRHRECKADLEFLRLLSTTRRGR